MCRAAKFSRLQNLSTEKSQVCDNLKKKRKKIRISRLYYLSLAFFVPSVYFFFSCFFPESNTFNNSHPVHARARPSVKIMYRYHRICRLIFDDNKYTYTRCTNNVFVFFSFLFFSIRFSLVFSSKYLNSSNP